MCHFIFNLVERSWVDWCRSTFMKRCYSCYSSFHFYDSILFSIITLLLIFISCSSVPSTNFLVIFKDRSTLLGRLVSKIQSGLTGRKIEKEKHSNFCYFAMFRNLIINKTNIPYSSILISNIHDMFNFFDTFCDKGLQILQRNHSK